MTVDKAYAPHDGGGKSYADKLKTNVRFDQRLNRNVLEIVLEKTDHDSDLEISQDNIVNVFKTIGISIEKHVEGYQLHSKGKISLISVWMYKDIDLEQFCRDDNIKVAEGVMTGSIRPAGRKDVVVTIYGLDFNTPDTFVFDYLSKFGRVVTQNVIYSRYTEGPFRGKYDGARKYNIDFSDSILVMGTYHIIDGSKTRVFYRGNVKTCGRCHKFSHDCPGEGIARVCEENGGERTKLSDWMKELWGRIGFTPDRFELLDEDDKSGSLIMDTVRFPRLEKVQTKHTNFERYCGFTVRNLPSSLSNSDICEFLNDYIITTEAEMNINRGLKNSSVTLENVDPEVVTKVVEAIDFPQCRKKFFNVPLYCRPLRVQTPEKAKTTDSAPAKTSATTAEESSSSKTPKKAGNKTFSTQVVGGVKIKNMSEQFKDYEFNEVNLINENSSKKRNSTKRSPLEAKRDSKVAKV